MDTPTTTRRRTSRRARALFVALVLVACTRSALPGEPARTPLAPVADDPPAPSVPAPAASDPDDLVTQIRLASLTRVLVELALDLPPDPMLTDQDALQQRELIAQTQDAVMLGLTRVQPILRAPHHAVRRLETTPYMALDVTLAELVQLLQMPQLVRSVVRDETYSTRALAAPAPPAPPIDRSVRIVWDHQVATGGCAGTGQVVVVIDTGVDDVHPLLAGHVISGSGVGRPLADDTLGWHQGDCEGTNYGRPFGTGFSHGSQVAAIISSNGHLTQGVAPGAKIVSIRVVREDGKIYASDVAKALEEVYLHWSTCHAVASVCISLASETRHPDSASCDGDPEGAAILKTALELQARQIAVVSGSGNDWERAAISMPACLSPMISVASSDLDDVFATYSNASADLGLIAPGDGLRAFPPGGGAIKIESGTSMAGPHVAAAFAVLRQFAPEADLVDLVDALVGSGPLVTIPSTGGMQVHRLDVLAALRLVSGSETPDCITKSLDAGPPDEAGY